MKFRDIELTEEEVLEILEILFEDNHDLEIVRDKILGVDHVYIHYSDGEPVKTIRLRDNIRFKKKELENGSIK